MKKNSPSATSNDRGEGKGKRMDAAKKSQGGKKAKKREEGTTAVILR